MAQEGIGAWLDRLKCSQIRGALSEKYSVGAVGDLLLLSAHDIETLAVGQRLITTNKGSLPEVLGNYGVKLDTITSESICSAIVQSLENECDNTLALQQQKFVKDHYSWGSTVRTFLSLYQ